MRRLLRSEQGVALTAAMFTLAVIALFSALVASTAGQLSDTSNHDRDAKRALAMANTGVNTALYHLNRVGSTLTHLGCVTNVQTTAIAQTAPHGWVKSQGGSATVNLQAGHCPNADGRAGNDGRWNYEITLLNNGQACDQQYTTQTQVNNALSVSAGGISVLRRCIFAEGQVNGVQRRVQQEVYSEFRLFYGLIGTDLVHVSGGADVAESHVGSNEAVVMEAGTIYNGQIEVAPEIVEDVQETVDATGQWGVTGKPEPWILEPADGTGFTADNNSGISCLGPLLDLGCTAANAGWKSVNGVAKRRLLVPALYTVTISAGDYYLCELNVSGGTVLVTGTARIFIDPGMTGCSNGGLKVTGGLLNATGLAVAQNLGILMLDEQAISIGGGLLTQANLSLYAPGSTVTVGGGVVAPVVKGSVSAKEIRIESGTFIADPLLNVTTPFAQIAGRWHPGDWSECTPYSPDPNNKYAGCGSS